MIKEMTHPLTATAINAARLSIVAVVTYQLLLIALIFIRPDLDPYWHTLSEWALGPHGWIMSIAFLISATSYGSLLVAVRSQVRGVVGAIGFAILAICFVGTFGVGVFTTDPFDIPKLTTTGILHIITGSSALMLLPFAALLINLSLALKNQAWARARRLMIWTAFLPLAGLAGFIVHLAIFVIPLGDNAHGPGVPLGWPARFLFLTYMVWLIVLACQVIKLNASSDANVSTDGADT